MNFSAWAIRNPIAPILGFVVLLFLGWQSFNALPITRFPNIDVPLVAVTVAQPGAAPAELESQVTKQIEDAVAGITGVKNVISTVNDGMSTTAIEFRMEIPTDKAVQEVKDAIDAVRGDLPGGIEAPIVSRIDDALNQVGGKARGVGEQGSAGQGAGAERREEILAAALRLFGEYGLYGVSTRQIAQAVLTFPVSSGSWISSLPSLSKSTSSGPLNVLPIRSLNSWMVLSPVCTT